MKKVRLGIIGATGFASKRPMPGLRSARNCALKGLCGRPGREDTLRQLAEQYKVPKVYMDVDELLAAPQIDAVYIATPVDLRRVIDIKHPSTRVSYELDEIGRPDLDDIMGAFLRQLENEMEEVEA